LPDNALAAKAYDEREQSKLKKVDRLPVPMSIKDVLERSHPGRNQIGTVGEIISESRAR
jgi:hypothetical protein